MKIKPHWLFLALIIVLAALLRFSHLEGLNHFTYDQARDVLYIKRIIVDHKFRLIGTQSSIPGLYTPPFYYYLMAPFLWLFKLNPVGLDYTTAFFGVLTIGLLYFLLLELTQHRGLSLVLTSLYAFQPAIVHQSRFAWNPNTTPFFVTLAVFSLFKILKKKANLVYYLALFFALGMIINLHYAGAVFFAAALFPLVFLFRRLSKKNLMLGLAIFSFLTFLPLFLFDLRHNFFNTKGVVNYLLHGTEDKIPPPPFLVGIIDKYRALLGLVFPIGESFINHLALALSVLLLFWLLWRRRDRELTILCWLFFGSIFLASLYKRGFFFFYLTFLFPLPFLVLGKALSLVKKKKWFYLSLLLLVILAGNNFFLSWSQVKEVRSDLGERLMGVAEFLAPRVVEPFNLAAINDNPERFGSNAVDYRYFLEAFFNKRSLDWDPVDYQQAETLYLISEVGEIKPLSVGIWELEMFSPQEVLETWEVSENVVVYKLGKGQ